MMQLVKTLVLVFALALAGGMRTAAAEPLAGSQGDPSGNPADPAFVLGPPPGAGPVIVEADFELHDLNGIDDEAETFEFSGALTLTWQDPRQAFDPAVAGVEEKVYQGAYQFNEISPGWYPQVVLINESGLSETNGVVLRVRFDGSSTMVETLNMAAKAEFAMRRYPLDSHRLDAVFEVLGFDADEVELRVATDASSPSPNAARLPEWSLTEIDLSIRDRSATRTGGKRARSAFVVSVDVERDSFYVTRLIILPLVVIVFLSFSVFWMERSSLGDRTSVSFIGILTGVTYQLVMSDDLPRIAYFTLMHGFLNLSFLTMGATVVMNLVVSAQDKRGKPALGDRIDRRCRWAFPLVYVSLSLVMFLGFTSF